MRKLTKSTLAILTTAIVGVTALTPAVYAQPLPDRNGEIHRIDGAKARAHRPNMGGARMMQRPALFGLLAAPNAEAIDIAGVRLTHQLDLTDEQTLLLDALKDAALEAQNSLAITREAIRPVSEEDASDPDLVAGYAGIVAMTTARAEALEAMQPTFEAFVGSLDDEQIEKLNERPAFERNRRPNANLGWMPSHR